MNEVKSYVRVDEDGVFRIGNTRVMLDSLVAAFEQGHSPETIRQQYPALSLEEVYGSIAFYLAHLEEVGAYLRRQDAVWKDWEDRFAVRPSPVLERLRVRSRRGREECQTVHAAAIVRVMGHQGDTQVQSGGGKPGVGYVDRPSIAAGSVGDFCPKATKGSVRVVHLESLQEPF